MTTASSQPDLILTARWIICNAQDAVLTDHGVAVKNGVISEIAPLNLLKEKYYAPDLPDKIIGGARYALMPGFVNSHHHSFGVSSILRGVKDQVLEPWIVEINGAPGLPKKLAAKLAAASLLRSGITTTVDMCGGVGTLEEFADGVSVTAQGYKESGLKTILAPGMRAQNLLSQADGEDAQFLQTLHSDLAKIANAMVCRERPATLEYISCVNEFIANFNNQTMTEIWFGPPGPQWCGMDAFSEITQAAEKSNTRIQTHALESFSEHLEGRCTFGKSRILSLADAGLLSPRLSLAHMVWAGDDDIAAVTEHGVAISHNPSSNLRLSAGIAPLPEFLDTGIVVGLGLDGTSLHDDDDMFGEIRLAAGLQNARVGDKHHLSPRSAFDLATRGGAKLIGRAGKAGEITLGASADLFLLDLTRLEWPWADPDFEPLDLIYAIHIRHMSR